MIRFPDERLASFTCGFGASKEGFYDVVCTEGRVRLDPAYTHADDLRQEVTPAGGKTKVNKFKKRDQVVPAPGTRRVITSVNVVGAQAGAGGAVMNGALKAFQAP